MHLLCVLPIVWGQWTRWRNHFMLLVCKDNKTVGSLKLIFSWVTDMEIKHLYYSKSTFSWLFLVAQLNILFHSCRHEVRWASARASCWLKVIKKESSHKDDGTHKNGSTWYFFLKALSSEGLKSIWASQLSAPWHLASENKTVWNLSSSKENIWESPCFMIESLLCSYFRRKSLLSASVLWFIISWTSRTLIAVRNLYQIFRSGLLFSGWQMGFSSFIFPWILKFGSLPPFSSSLTDLLPGRKADVFKLFIASWRDALSLLSFTLLVTLSQFLILLVWKDTGEFIQ